MDDGRLYTRSGRGKSIAHHTAVPPITTISLSYGSNRSHIQVQPICVIPPLSRRYQNWLLYLGGLKQGVLQRILNKVLLRLNIRSHLVYI
jgi:hypothetical protein